MSSENTIGLSGLAPNPGARKRRKRVGNGEGSGHGKTCCRGGKGQTARSGGRVRRGFEGGQMPLHRRLPKYGFTSRKKINGENVYQLVSLKRLTELFTAGGDITVAELVSRKIIRNPKIPVKVLGGGEWKGKVKVEAHAFSASAKSAIEAAGGQVVIIK